MLIPRISHCACAVLLFSLSGGAAEPPPVVDKTKPVYTGTEFLPENVENRALALELAKATEQSAPVLVVSGGISLGAYQAGFISTLVRFWSVARDSQGHPAGNPLPRVWTGASAGAVNALLGGLASCDEAFAASQWTPEDSLFWNVWVDELDLDLLLPLDDEDRSDHLFSQPHMTRILERIARKTGELKFRDQCSFAFGNTVTNLEGRDVLFGSGSDDSKAPLKRVTEKLVFQVTTHGPGRISARLPFMEGKNQASLPYIAVSKDEQVYYPSLGVRPASPGGQGVEMEKWLRGPEASGAFPLAFPPVEVEVSFNEKGSWSEVSAKRFIDGGFLNNNPVDLAVRLGEHWIETRLDAETPTARLACLDEDPASPKDFDRARFPIVYLDQDVIDWAWKEPAKSSKKPGPLMETYFQNLGTVLSAARDSVVLDTLEHDPNLSGRIKIPRRQYVLPSEYRFAMLGFFDQRFRQHDFYRGMQDALYFLATQLTSTRAVEALVPLVEGELVGDREQRIRQVLGISSQGFKCVADGACDDSSNSAGLKKLSTVSAILTARAKKGGLESDDIDSLLKELGDAGYQYGGGVMGTGLASGTREDLWTARMRVGRGFHDLVSHQEYAMRVVLRPLGATFLDDWLTYTPPRYAFTLQVSRRRGLGLGLEAPVRAFEYGRADKAYNRSEVRVGGTVSGFGVRDMDQLELNSTRVRWVSLDGYVDWVSDMDGFEGRLRPLDLGPYVRWRAGLGVSGSYLSSPDTLAFQVPEARLGFDLAELVGVRVSVPLFLLKKTTGEPLETGLPKYFKETSVALNVNLTVW